VSEAGRGVVVVVPEEELLWRLLLGAALCFFFAGACEPPPVVTGVLDTGVGELPPAGVLELDGLVTEPALVVVCGTLEVPLFCFDVKFEDEEPPPLLLPLGLETEPELPLPLFIFWVKPELSVPPVDGAFAAGCCAGGATLGGGVGALWPGLWRPVSGGGGVLLPPLSASAGAARPSAITHAETAASRDGTEGMVTASNIRRQTLSP
jgi:hypothetical protein